MSTALLVIDVQAGFDDPVWGRRNNAHCERNVAELITGWRAAGQPLVFVRHDSVEPDSPLRVGGEGNRFKECVHGTPDLLVSKATNSAFLGEPDLGAWLSAHGVDAVAVCGIQTNMCCETTARMAANLGYRTTFVLDATHTFDRRDLEGRVIAADELARVTAANLNDEFAEVVTTRALLDRFAASAAG